MTLYLNCSNRGWRWSGTQQLYKMWRSAAKVSAQFPSMCFNVCFVAFCCINTRRGSCGLRVRVWQVWFSMPAGNNWGALEWDKLLQNSFVFFLLSDTILKERPSSAIYPSETLRQSLLGSRKGRSTLSLNKSVSTNNIAGYDCLTLTLAIYDHFITVWFWQFM